MSRDDLTAKRILYAIGFAFICIAIGFFFATGWETPTRVGANPSVSQTTTTIAPSTSLIDEEGNSPFVSVAEMVKPTVVNITAEKELEGQNLLPFELFDWGPFFREPPDDRRIPEKPRITSGGSGIILDQNGHILTNNHVIAGAEDIVVKLADRSEHPAELIGADPETDVALIKIDASLGEEMVARLGDSDNIRIGEWAIAIGNPFGLDWTVTVGVISARGRSNLRIGGDVGPSYQNFIQTDASINLGNSGGPLVNIEGQVIGINTAINAQGHGIGFAIPINLARKVSEQLMTTGKVHRGYLGIFVADLDDIKREALGIEPEINGIFVDGVQEDTPADRGGLKGGDVITEVEEVPVKDATDFRFRIADVPPGTTVAMTVWQKGKLRKMRFKLADRSEYVKLATAPHIKREQNWLGIEVIPTDSRQGRRLGVEDINGMLVIRVEPDSPAEGLLEAGDVIVELGGDEIEGIEDYQRAIEKLKERKKAIPFWVVRNDRRTFIPIRPE